MRNLYQFSEPDNGMPSPKNKSRLLFWLRLMASAPILILCLLLLSLAIETSGDMKTRTEANSDAIRLALEEECKVPGQACLLAVAKRRTGDDNVKVSLEGDTASVDYFTEILTTHFGMVVFNTKTKELFDDIFAQFPKVQKITIQSRTKFVDERGQESIEPWARVTYTRANYESINWKNVRSDSIPRLADEFWAHPAYYREGI